MKVKVKLGLSIALAAICWLALCIDIDTIMYLSGIMAIILMADFSPLFAWWRLIKRLHRKNLSRQSHLAVKGGVA